MKRGLKLGIGIPITLIGLFMTIAGIAIVVLVGPDGTFTLPATSATGNGHALVFEALDVRGDLPSSGRFSTTFDVRVTGTGRDVFIGIGSATAVARYLNGIAFDRIEQINWPGGMRTEPNPGTGTPRPPGKQSFWVASDAGRTASVRWTLAGGDWTLVVMNTDASAGVDVVASGSVALPILGPAGISLLIAGIVILALGAILTVSGAKTPRTAKVVPQPTPPAIPAPYGSPTKDEAVPPPRPDAGGI